MNFFERRQLKKIAHETLRHARHVRNMREDVMTPAELKALDDRVQTLRDALTTQQPRDVEKGIEDLSDHLRRTAPHIGGGGLRENFEILVVAVAVAMALRTYFIQPFKIPTGSMQPTLYGVTSVPKDHPGLTDRMPFKLVKFVLTGEWYSVCRAQADGYLNFLEPSPDQTHLIFTVAQKKHLVPRDAVDDLLDKNKRYDLKYRIGDFVKKGDIIWAGITTRGDHVFVNKVIWNFRKPKRGEIMVFYTTGIQSLPQGTHYIKRMCGLPNETVSINPPDLVINGKPVHEPGTIARVESRKNGYAGYQLAGRFYSPGVNLRLSKYQYFAMGDNTGNSKDSRYWGAVPAKNLVGPAAFVYWPLSKRWGLAK